MSTSGPPTFLTDNNNVDVQDSKNTCPSTWTVDVCAEKKKNFPWIISNSEKIRCSICDHVKNFIGSKIHRVSISKEGNSTWYPIMEKKNNTIDICLKKFLKMIIQLYILMTKKFRRTKKNNKWKH